MDGQGSSKSNKFLALIGGLFFACLLCGAPLFYTIWTGRFQQFAQPFAYAAQTSAVMPIFSETPALPAGALGTSVDLTSQPFIERFHQAGPYISEALEYYAQGAYAEAILSWDKALEIVPDWSGGYYNRGLAYFKLLNNQRSQEEYLHYLSLAGADFDKAIELSATEDGDYYFGRFQYYDALASNQTLRVDADHLEMIALDNLRMASRLGDTHKDTETKLALVYAAVGKCDEALEQASRLIAENAEPDPDMIGSLSVAYFCKNDSSNALKYMSQVVERVDNCRSRLDRARIQYAMNDLDGAMADLDYSIAKDPYYCGMRYYLRGLIYIEKDDLEKGQEDLNFGMGQTWEQGGLLSYAQGKIALAQGDEASAIRYFQEAESTYKLHDPILLKIQSDLAALGAPPLEMTPSFPSATAISIPTALTTPRPTSSPDPSLPTPVFTEDPSLRYAQIVNLEETTGPIQIGPNYDGIWRFQPALSLDHREVQRLSVWLISSDTSQRLPRQVLLWNFRNNMWGGNNEVHWGENQINYPNEYVSVDGDIYIRFVNSDDSVQPLIDTLGITLVLQRTDGSIEVHGMTP